MSIVLVLLLTLFSASVDEGSGLDPHGGFQASSDDGNGLDPHGTPRAVTTGDDGSGLDPHG